MAKTNSASRQPDWTRTLKPRFTLKDGTYVVKLEDAARAIQVVVQRRHRAGPGAATIARLMRAETSKRADIEARRKV